MEIEELLDTRPGSVDLESDEDRNAIIDALHRVCDWLLKTDAIFMFTAMLASEGDRCPALARYLSGKSVDASRSPEGTDTLATITVGNDEIGISQPRWDTDGVPVCWPWDGERR